MAHVLKQNTVTVIDSCSIAFSHLLSTRVSDMCVHIFRFDYLQNSTLAYRVKLTILFWYGVRAGESVIELDQSDTIVMLNRPNSSLVNPQQQYSQFVIEVSRKYNVNPASVSEILQGNATLFMGTPAIDSAQLEREQAQLQEVLNRENFFESKEESELKKGIVEWLGSEVRAWSSNIASRDRKIIRSEAGKYAGELLQFGSSILGLSSGESDLDFVLVVPNFIERRTHFYQQFKELVASRQHVTNLKLISEAKVPILTFEYRSVPVDISFSQIDCEVLPPNLTQKVSDEVIAAIREKESVTAILGRKNNQMILEAVERVGQLENFKNALRLLKVWAKKKGVYSNALGFLGGIALAIMVAKMCQLFPRYSVPLLLREFFSLYSCWDWKIPVMIEPYRENVEHRHADLRWRKEARDFAMAVLTPGFPEINTTSRVNRTTLQVLKNCLRLGKLNYLPPEGWDCLFRQNDFFRENEYFAVLDVVARGEDRQFQEWFRYIESKLIVLISQFDRLETENKVEIVPCPRSFLRRLAPESEYVFCRTFFIGFKVADLPTLEKLDIFCCVRKFILDVNKRQKQAPPPARRRTNVFVYSMTQEEVLADPDIVWRQEEEKDPAKRPGAPLRQPEKKKLKKFEFSQ